MKNALIVIDFQNNYFPGGAWSLERRRGRGGDRRRCPAGL